MTIKNFKWISPIKNKYVLDGEIELYPSGYIFTKITKINNVEADSVMIRNQIKHEEILNYIKNMK